MRVFGRKVGWGGVKANVVATLPGSGMYEIIPIRTELITTKGELVLISRPYPNLAKKETK